jgi:acetyl esterase/lipase
VALADAQQALRLVRSRATEWRIDPHRVAVMGFSAGGHLASTLGTQYDSGQPTATDPVARQSCRPDALILMYPVISSEPGVAHAGSFENLLGKTPSPAQLTRFSNDRQVTPDTPPTLLIHAADDDLVPAENSIRFYQALLRHHVPATMYLYPDGGHGFSFARHKTGPVTRWPQDCMAWLEWIGWK